MKNSPDPRSHDSQKDPGYNVLTYGSRILRREAYMQSRKIKQNNICTATVLKKIDEEVDDCYNCQDRSDQCRHSLPPRVIELPKIAT